jgi:hypothetical protein
MSLAQKQQQVMSLVQKQQQVSQQLNPENHSV